MILLCWLPYFYASYPGNGNSDSISEIQQQLGLQPLSNHHPIMHQLFIGLGLRIGSPSLTAGMAAYTMLQMLLLAFSFSLCVHYLSEVTSPFIAQSALAFYSLYTVNAFFAVTMWKDVMFGGITLVLMVLLLMDSQRDEKENRRKTYFRTFAILCVSFLFCTLRNNGWYAFLLGFPLYILCRRKSWKRLSLVFAGIVLAMGLYNHVLFQVLEVKPSASGEALSVPLQQIARTVKYAPHSIEEQEEAVLREIFPNLEELGALYKSHISDPVKAPNVFRSSVFDQDPMRYVRCWARIGMKNPTIYIEAFLLQNYGYWYPDVTYVNINSEIRTNDLGLMHRAERENLRRALVSNHGMLSTTSPLSVFYCLALFVWLLIVSGAMLWLKGQKEMLAPMVILAAVWLTTLASPVFCEYRYLYAVVVCAPLFLGTAIGLKCQGSEG